MSGPLAGMRVLELAHIMAGPACGLMLADMGADVIKVEKAQGGDDTRRFVPPDINGESAAFMMMNRNKRGVAIDIKKPAGLRAIRRLAAGADIVIENFRPGTMARLGLGYEDLARENPALVYGSISGFGATGPLADRSGVDLVAQGFSGLMSITGEGPGRPPVKVGAPVSDTTAGMLLALAVVAAYSHRLRTGEGQRVETSLIEAAMAHTYWQSAIFLATGHSAGPLGSAHPLTSPYQAYACADGYIVLGAPNEHNWQRLLEAIEARELARDPRFADNARRREHNAALTEAIEARLAARPRAEWIERLEAVGVPCGPLHTIGEALCHPHTRAREMVVEVEHPRAGRMATLGCPMKFSRTPAGVRKAAPLYAEDTRPVLEAHGFSVAEIEALAAEGAIAVADALAGAEA
jgi:crotonobetainyl-CoA:carnitine CoA-transferase CaiB-like acyl-CoA transferase